ncbi:hypothetical protein J2S70_000706 [Trueperella bonasi]|uniref:Uncharacterized protein n=1 Tax=Trueperella bonasi TaxID=312286 RepID=A0ABT9NFG4_9ACTO|nr:hypothetical protein [Trueperella bonasi]
MCEIVLHPLDSSVYFPCSNSPDLADEVAWVICGSRESSGVASTWAKPHVYVPRTPQNFFWHAGVSRIPPDPTYQRGVSNS